MSQFHPYQQELGGPAKVRHRPAATSWETLEICERWALNAFGAGEKELGVKVQLCSSIQGRHRIVRGPLCTSE